MCWHDYEYIGYVEVFYWLAGVAGGIPLPSMEEAKQCNKCGKVKVI